ncbi:MAG: hypothetical protein ACLFTI_03110 [Anaerolineales bacterium]
MIIGKGSSRRLRLRMNRGRRPLAYYELNSICFHLLYLLTCFHLLYLLI